MKTTIRRSACLLAVSAMTLLATRASADPEQTTRSYCISGGVSMQGGFLPSDRVENGGTLRLHGSADITSSGVLELTSFMSNAEDSVAYYNAPLDLQYMKPNDKSTNRPFSVYFSFSIGPKIEEDKSGAGLAFLVQNSKDGQSQTAGNGKLLGFGGIEPSMAIEFDTEADEPPAGTVSWPDPSPDHVGFMLDGKHAEHPAYYLHQQGFTSQTSEKWHVWIEYTGADTDDVNVYLSDSKVKPSSPIPWQINKNPAPTFKALFPDDFDAAYWLSVDADNLLPQGYFGLTAATYGESTNTHAVYEWEFSNVGIPCACQGDGACPTSIPACSSGAKTQERGVCVECTEWNTTACAAAGEVCDTEVEECVECVNSGDCSSNKKGPVCNKSTRTCEPCAKDADCAGNPRGDRCALSGASKGQCVECVTDAPPHCPSGEPVCDQATNTCVKCVKSSDCTASAPVCDPVKKECVPCAVRADCANYPATPACSTSGPKAGQCVPDPNPPCDSCPEGWVCNEDLPGCVPPCGADKECPYGFVCDEETMRCEPDECACALGDACDEPTKECGTIAGGGCACTAAGSPGSEGLLAGIMGALGAAAVFARRRRR